MGGGRADTRYFLLHIVCRERSGRESDTVPQGFEAQSCFDTENVSAAVLLNPAGDARVLQYKGKINLLYYFILQGIPTILKNTTLAFTGASHIYPQASGHSPWLAS